MTHSRKPIFFGWWVVAAGLIGLTFGSYNIFIGILFALFVKPLEEAFAWTRTEISLALTICTYTIVVLAPLLGSMIDRFGVRRILLSSMLLFGLVVASLSLLTSSLWHFYAMYLLIPLIAVGTLPTTFTRTLLNWFDRQRGLALGITLSGVGVGAIIMPPVIQHLISTVGWRETYVVMGLSVLLIAWPVMYWLFRDHPADMGLAADGVDVDQVPDGKRSVDVPGLEFRDALGTRAYWIIFISILLLGLGGTGILIHFVAMLTDRGMTLATAAATFSLFGATVVIGRVSCGFLVDRFFAPHIAVVFLAGPVIALALLASETGTSTAYLAAVLLGLGLGAEFDLLSYLVSRYLGLRAYGIIYGSMFSAFQIGAGIGPVIMGHSYDRLGSYTTGLWTLCVSMAAAVAVISRLGAYEFAVHEDTVATRE